MYYYFLLFFYFFLVNALLQIFFSLLFFFLLVLSSSSHQSEAGRGPHSAITKRISADCHLDMPCMPPELFVENTPARRGWKERYARS